MSMAVSDDDPPRWVYEIVALLFAVATTMNVVWNLPGHVVVVPIGVGAGVAVYMAFYRLFFVEEQHVG